MVKIKTSLAMAVAAMLVAGGASAATVVYDYSGTGQFYYDDGSGAAPQLYDGDFDVRVSGVLKKVAQGYVSDNGAPSIPTYYTVGPLTSSIKLGSLGTFDGGGGSVYEQFPVGSVFPNPAGFATFALFNDLGGVYFGTSVTTNVLNISTGPINAQFQYDPNNWNYFTNNNSSFLLQSVTDGKFTTTIDGLGPISAVPEPASWATMIIGFGVIGSMLRLRRSRARVRVAS